MQVRSSLKSSHVSECFEEVTCGGNALRFYAAVRLRVLKTGLLKTEDKVKHWTLCYLYINLDF